MLSSVKNDLRNANLFKPSPDSGEQEDEQQHVSNILSTRVYLAILTLILIIVALVAWLYPETTVVVIQRPTADQVEVLPDDAYCPCSRISVSYDQFMSLQTTFHPVCQSDFITDRWFKALLYGLYAATPMNARNFRSFGTAQFQAVAGFCRLSNASIQHSIGAFAMYTLISPQVLSETALRRQIQVFIEQLRLTAPATFGTQLQVVREMTVGNRLMVGLQTNFFLAYYIYNASSFGITQTAIREINVDQSMCDCGTDVNCKFHSGILEPDTQRLLMIIPGIFAGCRPVDSILGSTLECFSNQTCVDQVISFFNTTERFRAMSVLGQSRFKLNSTVKSIVEQLMVEEWSTNISYKKYFDQCAPYSCTYLKVQRHDFLYALTKLISLLSGLTVALRLIIPIVVRLIKRRRNPDKIPICTRLSQFTVSVKKVVVELNILKRNSSDDRQVRYQRWGTRLFIILVVVSVQILAYYTLLNKAVHRQTIHNPTESRYIQLEQIYPTSLSCLCTSISMPYSTFITIKPHYHQVCSSDLISSQWIRYNRPVLPGYSRLTEYRRQAATQFRLLATFCEQAKQTVDDALRVFLETPFVGSEVISQDVFESQMNLLVGTWQSSIVNGFLHTIQLVRAINQGNQLMTPLNVRFSTDSETNGVKILPVEYDNCTCALSPSCRSIMSIFNVSKVYHVPNFFTGCFPIESLLASTLECFYNLSCMIEIHHHISGRLPFHFSPLDRNLSSPYESVEAIVNRLMIDSWSSNVSFNSYYNTCAPLSCTFENTGRNSLFYTVTTIIGVFGGLTIGFKLLILMILQLIERIMNGFSCSLLVNFIKNLFICGNDSQITRRLHFLLAIVTLTVLYMCSTFIPRLKTVEIQKPSLSVYQGLTTRFPESLQCSCSHISIKYQSFLDIVPRFHQVCSSELVSDAWIKYLYGEGYLPYRFDPDDFLYSATGQFQLLASFCRLSQEMVNGSLLRLVESDFINTQLLSPNLLHQRISKTINDSQKTTPNLFLSILSLIRETTRANMIMSAWSTNWVVNTPNTVHHQWGAETIPLSYDGCNCELSSKCTKPSRGMMAGCYALEALFQTTLHCLYNQRCIDSTNTFEAMNISSSQSSRFDINSTIESIVNELMVDEYGTNISWEKYFSQCAPSSCRYSYTDYSNVIEGLTNLIELEGGLMIICYFMAVTIVKLFRYRTQQIRPMTD